MSRWPLHGRGDVGFFDRVARAYDLLTPAGSAADFAPAFDRATRSVDRVLDLAGGTGRVADALAAAGYEPLVADLSRGMLSRARARGLPVVQVDAGRLPLRDDAVDAAVVVDAYHHLPDPPAALVEAARVVAPGGVVAVQDVDPSTIRGRGVVATERLAGMGSRFSPADDVAAELTRAGLRSLVLERGFAYTVVGVVPPAE